MASILFCSGCNTKGLVNQEIINKISDDSYFINSSFNKENIRKYNVFKDGQYISNIENILNDFTKEDIKYELYDDTKLRYINISDGYAFDLDNINNLKIDYSLAKYGVKFNGDVYSVHVSIENNAYSINEAGYNTYLTEWFDRYINNINYLDSNNLSYTKATIYRSKDIKENHEVSLFSIKINDCDIEFPYYQILTIRKDKDYSKFAYILLKTKEENNGLLNSILNSFSFISKYGETKNYLLNLENKVNPKWSGETLKYFNKLKNQNTLDFGVFSASMPSINERDYEYKNKKINDEKERLEGINGLNKTYDIMPTYTHIGWYQESRTHFPIESANRFAGGNGFNNLPVLQFTYQFTINNNNVNIYNTIDTYTPMFDILRGVYDAQFKELALSIKQYGKPVLFRLNNEMNSDWTSYCGMMTLNDPEIFKLTWKHLYNIFEENGVDNCIWIFNPIAVSCPYSNWGEDLNYFPGVEYCQVLGLTNYEMNNSVSGETIESFKTRYTFLYNKNAKVFNNYLGIISEFACGSGGETTGVLYRNKELQAQWVEDMFKQFKNREKNKYLQNIKGAVWFGVNDYDSNGKITNALVLDSSLIETLDAFKNGFKGLEGEN